MNRILKFLFFVFIVSCISKDKKHQVFFGPKIIPVNGDLVANSASKIPESIPVSSPLFVKAGQPKLRPTNLNTRVCGEPKIIIAGSPKINMPGADTFLLPIVVKGVNLKMPAGNPEVVIAKDATAKDINPSNFSFYKTLHGLKHNAILSIIQDATGNLWFGTNGGACRYDGKSFTNFTVKEGLANNDVTCIMEDRNGNIWFGTNHGVSYYDGNTFTNFTEKEGLSNNVVWSVLEDKMGNIWFGTNGGVCRYDGQNFTSYMEKQGLANNVVWSILEDKTGKLWFGTNGGGVSCFDGKSFTNYTEKEGLANNYVMSILEDKIGNIWFATYSGVCRFDGKTFANFTEKEGLCNNVVWRIIQDKSGQIWMGTNGGVSRYDGKTFTNFTEAEGLSNMVVWSILEDKTGTFWFGTYGGGVCRYDGNSFTNYTESEGLSNNIVMCICEDKSGNLWFGTNGGGVCCYDGNVFTNYTVAEGLSNDIVWSIVEDKMGNIWFGTYGGGVCCFDGKSFYTLTENEGLPSNFVMCSLKDKNGNLWFGSYGGVTKYDGKSFTNFTEKEGLPHTYVSSILEDKGGNLWFGTFGGASKFDGKLFTNFTEKDGLANDAVTSILEDRSGNIWFGTYSGISRFDGKCFINFTEKEGLSNDAVFNIIQDVDENIWFGTREGLSKIERLNLIKLDQRMVTDSGVQNFNPIKEAFFYNYTHSDGFLGLNCRRNAVLQDRKGKLWWGTDILVNYNPKGNIVDATAPIVNLTNLKVFGENITWANLKAVYIDSTGKEIVDGNANDTLLSNGILLKGIKFDGLTKWYNLPENLSLPYNINNLTFSFIGVHMQSRNHIKYQYKLEGIDSYWSVITERTEAPYGNLPSGSYVFIIKAMNQSGVWSEKYEYKFVIRPPWWETWWFRTLVSLVIIGSGIYYVKWRERSLVAEKEKLEKTVKERTVEIVEQKLLIEEKHKEITDSINYAERIQRSFLATKELLDENLNEYFVMFQPKDVVSGDFYWATKTSSSGKGENFVLVTADSTGHGVPGAIMSLLNITSLEKAVETFDQPSDILHATRKIIIERLKKDGSKDGGKDGMDCSILSFNKEKSNVIFSGANNPVWIVRVSGSLPIASGSNTPTGSGPNGIESTHELIELEPDKMPVGKHDKDTQSFMQYELALHKGDVIYTLTDGYPDQFGGPKGKKFMYKRLKDLLVSIAHKPMREQEKVLKQTLLDWQGSAEQVDDITIIGVRV